MNSRLETAVLALAATPVVAIAGMVAIALAAGCTPLNKQQQQALTIGCQIDSVVQPLAVNTLPVLAPGTAPAAQVDTLLVHPAVVAACARLGGVPAAVAAGVVVKAGTASAAVPAQTGSAKP